MSNYENIGNEKQHNLALQLANEIMNAGAQLPDKVLVDIRKFKSEMHTPGMALSVAKSHS